MKALRFWAALALPATLIVGVDTARRGERLAALDPPHALGYGVTALVSLVCWGACLFAASRSRRARGLFAALFVLAFGLASAVQDEFFARYHVYVALDVNLNAESVGWALVGSLPMTWTLWIFGAGWFALAIVCVLIARRSAPSASFPLWASSALTLASLTVLLSLPTSYRGVQSSTPDVLYLHALRVGVLENVFEAVGGTPRAARFQLRRAPTLPPLRRANVPARNVIVIMQEAVRADMACEIPNLPCDLPSAPSHDVTPGRIVFSEMRSVSSSTAVSLATMWTGLIPTARRDALFSAPLIWEYATAAGYHTGYWTSQHPMFANTRLLVQGAPRDHCVWATELDPLADYLIGANDEWVVRRALADLEHTSEPFFGVVHLSNVHMPRRIDPERAPYQPTDMDYARHAEPLQLNYYRNSVFLSELAVAELIVGLRAQPYGERTIVIYLSDHGEAWFEHDQHNDHGSTLYEEEIRIPAWIDAPAGTLSQREEQHLRSVSGTRVFQTSVAPTLLDLLGVWDSAEIREHTNEMAGTPLTRPHQPRTEVLSNVSWAWEYGDPNWALMRDNLKLFAHGADDDYRCFNLDDDPGETHDLGPEACGDLAAVANDVFGMLPRDLGRLRQHPEWGWPR